MKTGSVVKNEKETRVVSRFIFLRKQTRRRARAKASSSSHFGCGLWFNTLLHSINKKSRKKTMKFQYKTHLKIIFMMMFDVT